MTKENSEKILINCSGACTEVYKIVNDVLEGCKTFEKAAEVNIWLNSARREE